MMKEAFVFAAPRELLNSPRHRSADTRISENILRLFYQDGKSPGAFGRKATLELTKSH